RRARPWRRWRWPWPSRSRTGPAPAWWGTPTPRWRGPGRRGRPTPRRSPRGWSAGRPATAVRSSEPCAPPCSRVDPPSRGTTGSPPVRPMPPPRRHLANKGGSTEPGYGQPVDQERTVVRIEVPAEEVELAADRLWLAGASAVGEDLAEGGRVRLTADVTDVAAVAGRWPVEEVAVDDALLDAWRAHAAPVRAGRRVVLQPAWRPAGDVGPDDVVVELDPGRAFGSGSHPA